MTLALKNASVSGNMNWSHQDSENGNLLTKDENAFSFNPSFGDGTTPGNAKIPYSVQLAIGAGLTTTINLSSGTLKDKYGNSIVFTKVCGLIVMLPQSVTSPTQASSITVGTGAAQPFNDLWGGATGKNRVKQSNAGVLIGDDNNGYTVTAGANCQIDIVNEDGVNTATVNFAVLGRT